MSRHRWVHADRVDQQADPDPPDDEEDRRQPELARLGEQQRQPRDDAHDKHQAEKPAFDERAAAGGIRVGCS